MVYGRRPYRRRGGYRRRRAGYRRRPLSTTSILTRKSATSQALQINTINKRIDRLNRRVGRDETKMVVNPFIRNVTFDGALYAEAVFPLLCNAAGSSVLVQGNSDGAVVGNKIYPLKQNLYVSVRYINHGQPNIPDWIANGISFRITVIQAKIPMSSSDSNVSTNDIFEYHDDGSTVGNEHQLNVVSPFARNVTQRWRILADKRYRMSIFNPQKTMKISFKPKTYRWFTDPDVNSDTINSSNYNRCFCIISVDNLYQIDPTEGEIVTNSLTFIVGEKLAYKDT